MVSCTEDRRSDTSDPPVSATASRELRGTPSPGEWEVLFPGLRVVPFEVLAAEYHEGQMRRFPGIRREA